MHPEEREKLAPQVWNIIRERQASPDNMVDIATLSPLFAEAGLRHTDYGFATLRDFLSEFREYLTMVDGISAGAGLPAKSYVQLKNFEKLENAEVQKADVPKDKELFAGPELSAAEKAALEEKLREVFAAVVSDEAGWVNLAGLGAPLKENGVDVKQLGFQKIMPFLEQFPELLELKHEPSPSGKAWVAYARLRAAETALPAGRAGYEQATVAVLGSDESSQAELSAEEKAELSPKVCSAVCAAISNEEGWVNLAGIGEALKGNGIDVKQLGFQKILPFLEQFPELLELKHEPTASGKAWVAYARLRENERREGDGKAEKAAAKPYAPRQGMSEYRTPESKYPSKDSWLFHWSRIPNLKIKELAEKALAEKWYYGAANAADAENYPILKNYLAYTFKRLVFEDKILYGDVADASHAGEEYAAFNTGLVDQKYEYIYALFKKNTMSPQPYWYLLDFVVAGEQSGKTLARLFYPLPKRADYFENQFRNMVYDTSTQLLCDYTHIIVERIGRFPLRFLQENCPPNMLDIDGIKLEEVYPKHAKDSERKHYFEQLGERIRNTPMVLNNLKNRLEAAIHLTLKRVEWNYKTAIPVYFPTRNLCSLLLPLCLSEEGQVDLALVVEPLQSGAYQGQTVLPLDLAYNNSRLLTRPDSDWLRPDSIQSNGSDDEEE